MNQRTYQGRPTPQLEDVLAIVAEIATARETGTPHPSLEQRLSAAIELWAEDHWSPDTPTRPLQPLWRSPRTTTTPKARKAAL